ncbi:MAG TPA: EamA family transporter [Gaiellaceae bacterium]|jgi:drug/metabolite transporter (DMT)-like permease
MAAVLLALAASASWGVSDFLGGVKTRAAPVLTVLSVSQPAGLILLGAIVLARWEPPPHGLPILWAVLAGLGGAIGIGALYQGLAVGSMGIVAPITSTSPLIPLTVGLARGERPSALQLAGIGVAIVGVAFAGWEPARPGARRQLSAGAGLAVLAAIAFGSSQVALQSAAADDPYWATLILRTASSLFVLAVILRSRPGHSRAGMWLVLVVIGLLDSGATELFAVATTKGLLSVVAVLAALYPVLVAILARVVLHERLTVVQRGGALAAVAGAAAISAG